MVKFKGFNQSEQTDITVESVFNSLPNGGMTVMRVQSDTFITGVGWSLILLKWDPQTGMCLAGGYNHKLMYRRKYGGSWSDWFEIVG